MRLDAGHRVVIALTGFAIGLRVLMPIHTLSRFGPQVDVAATILQVVGILLLGAALFFIVPSTWGPVVSRRGIVVAGLILGWLLTALAFAFVTSKTGLVLSLEQTNWSLTTVAAVVLSLLSSLTWGLLRNRNAWAGLRKGLVASLLIVLVGAGLSVAHQWQLGRIAALRQKQETERRQAEARRNRIIEGEQIGPLHLGTSVDELRVAFQHTFSGVGRTRTGLVQYAWCCYGPASNEDWWVIVDPNVERSVGISLTGNGDFTWDPKTNQIIPLPPWEIASSGLPYETTKGIRFGQHSSETVSAVYGPPSKTYTFDYGRASFYYAPLRTEFEFVCTMTKVQPKTLCDGPSLVLSRITIFAPGWSPETLWGQGGRR